MHMQKINIKQIYQFASILKTYLHKSQLINKYTKVY